MIRELTRGYTQTRVFMDTPVVIELSAREYQEAELADLTERAYGWFGEVERRCSRFDDASELRRLSQHVGDPVRVSTLLFSAIHVSLEIARCTDGALDPTLGAAMESLGFTTNYITGERASTLAIDPSASYRDVVLDHDAKTVTLIRPLSLDLGAVAKGLAIDLAAQELTGMPGFVVNAGGDIRAFGRNPDGEPWRIGIRHPRIDNELLTCLSVSDGAVCTSGDYERPAAARAGHHILNPHTRGSATTAISATVIAPTAILADALSTAAFVLGIDAGLELLERQGLDGLIVGPDLKVVATPGMEKHWLS